MNTEARVLATLNKFKEVQASKQNLGADKNYVKNKVELGLVDELEYSLADLNAFLSEQQSVLNSFDSEVAKATSIIDNLMRDIQFKVTDSNTLASGRADMNKLSDIANQLGVPVTDLYPDFDEYTARMQEIDANSELLDEKANMLDNLGLL
jgi:DNA repair ATPase RecN